MMRWTEISPTLVGSHMNNNNHNTTLKQREDEISSRDIEEDATDLLENNDAVIIKTLNDPDQHDNRDEGVGDGVPDLLGNNDVNLEFLDQPAGELQNLSKRKIRNTKRLALRILKKFQKILRSKLDERQLASLNWAEEIIAKLEELEVKNKNNNATKENAIAVPHSSDNCEKVPPPAEDEKKWSTRKKRSTTRLALRIIERFDDRDPTKLTLEEISTLNWAKQMMTKLEELENENKNNNNSPASMMEKRTQNRKRESGDVWLPVCKKSKLNKISGTIMAVIDTSAKDGHILHENWSLVEAALASVFPQVYREMPGLPPKCQDAGWFQGIVKLVAFGDDRSIDMYKAALFKIDELWPGAHLDLVYEDDLAVQPKAWTWIPHTPFDKEAILKMIRDSNPDFPVHKWHIEKLAEIQGSLRKIYLAVNIGSLPLLAGTNGIISYAFGQITIQIDESDNIHFYAIQNVNNTKDDIVYTDSEDDQTTSLDNLEDDSKEEDISDSYAE